MYSLRLGAWERWQAAAGPWQNWATCPALTVPSGDEGETRPRSGVDALAIAAQLAQRLASARDGTAIILDLEPTLGIRIAARLNQLQSANAVLVLPRWPYNEAILPTQEMVGVLVETSQSLRQHRYANVVFVLDGQRETLLKRRRLDDPCADNRYSLALADLPNLTSFRAAGIQCILKLSHP